MPTVEEQLKKLVAEKLGVGEEKVVHAANFVDDLNADSLDLVELIMAIEDTFGKDGTPLEIPDEEAEKIRTVQDAVDYLKSHGVKDE